MPATVATSAHRARGSPYPLIPALLSPPVAALCHSSPLHCRWPFAAVHRHRCAADVAARSLCLCRAALKRDVLAGDSVIDDYMNRINRLY